MCEPVVLGFYGYSNTGKTNIIQRLIRRLTLEGCCIAVIKRSEKAFCIDQEGKDTWRYGSVGAHCVIFSSQFETDFLTKKKMDVSEILTFIQCFGCFDIVFVEGARDPNIPKIRVGDIKKRPYTILEYHNNEEEIWMYIKKELEKQKEKQKNNEAEISLEVNGKKNTTL
ncbi:MAG: molybdopterin-guanine dinucleotide biosynthesis protein B [Candidatus Thermoplasmatota archaeon]